MKLDEKLSSISSNSIPKLSDNQYATIGDFYARLIEPLLPPVDSVRLWQKLLVEYTYEPDAIFFLRRYQSSPKKDWRTIRRGFITEYHRGAYVCCDNFFAHYFFTMAFDGYVPTLREFKQSISERSFPYGFMSTAPEREIQAFRQGKDPRLNAKGWKLAHILPVNGMYDGFDYKRFADDHFPRGDRSQWRMTEHGYYSRIVDREMSPEERELLSAHFLRLSSPINYFLVPKKSNEVDALGGDIGEKRILLEHILHKMLERYGREMMDEFLAAARAPAEKRSEKDNSAAIINLVCRSDSKMLTREAATNEKNALGRPGSGARASQRKRAANTSSVTNGQLHDMVRLYLEEAVSFRGLEKRVLGIDSPARGGGFIAKKALNDAGVKAEHKGFLSKGTLHDLHERATPELRATLELVYGRGPSTPR